MIYDKIAFIGLGLIASSMFWATKRVAPNTVISGFARSSETRDVAREIGLCDQVCDNAADAVQDADLVVLCVPVGAMGAVMRAIASHLKPDSTLSDVGSVKAQVVAEIAPHVPNGVHFIPGHPLAGTEHSAHAG